jgi:hypothetical protein
MFDAMTSVPLAASDASPYIAGAAAILGALVGGLVSGGATYYAEKKRHEYEEARRDTQDLAVARGLARVLYDDLSRAEAQLRVEKQTGTLLPELGGPPVLSTEDRKVLFRYLDEAETRTVSFAQGKLDALAAARGLSAGEPEGLALKEERIDTTIAAGNAAQQALRRLAGYERER